MSCRTVSNDPRCGNVFVCEGDCCLLLLPFETEEGVRNVPGDTTKREYKVSLFCFAKKCLSGGAVYAHS